MRPFWALLNNLWRTHFSVLCLERGLGLTHLIRFISVYISLNIRSSFVAISCNTIRRGALLVFGRCLDCSVANK